MVHEPSWHTPIQNSWEYLPRGAQRSFFPLQPYSKKTLRKNVPESTRKYKRNAPWASYNTPYIELIQYGRRIGKKVYWPIACDITWVGLQKTS